MKKIVAMGLAVCMGVVSLSGCAAEVKTLPPGENRRWRSRPERASVERTSRDRAERARMGQARP